MPQPPRPIEEPLHSRIIWFAILAGALIWLALASFVRAGQPPDPRLAFLVRIAVGVAVVGLVASLVLARLPRPPDAARARSRMVIRLALSEIGALLGGVMWLQTGDPWSWAAAGLGLLGILLAYPHHAGTGPADGAQRMIRG